MLLEKPIKKGDIISIKLTSGEEVLGCYVEDSDSNLTVEKPATISATPEGKMGIIPWMMTSRTTKFLLNKNTVVTFVTTEDDIAKAYTQATTDLKLV